MVRYADDFRVFCRYKESAEKTKIAITQWIEQRLKLEVSQEKTRIVNVRKRYSDFLGFKIKMIPRRKKLVVKSHISDKQFKTQKDKLVSQAKKIASPSKGKTELEEIRLYNSMVLGMQNYYQIATNVNLDCMKLNRAVMAIFTNRLGASKKGRLRKTGRQLTTKEATRYGKSKMLRYVAGEGEPIFPVGYIQHRKPMAKVYSANCYTPEGRKFIHTNLSVDKLLMYQLMKLSLENRTIEYVDNRISLFSAQHGKCAITLEEFQQANEIHCHHIVPTRAGGNDDYKNLILVKEAVHRLIHAKTEEELLQGTKPDEGYIGNGDYIYKIDRIPSDEEVFQTIRESGRMIRIGDREIPPSKLDTEFFTIYWYSFKSEMSDGWHIDGRIVAKNGYLTVKKDFVGMPEAIEEVKKDYYIQVDMDEKLLDGKPQPPAFHEHMKLVLPSEDSQKPDAEAPQAEDAPIEVVGTWTDDTHTSCTWIVKADSFWKYTLKEYNYKPKDSNVKFSGWYNCCGQAFL